MTSMVTNSRRIGIGLNASHDLVNRKVRIRHAFLRHELVGEERVTNSKRVRDSEATFALNVYEGSRGAFCLRMFRMR